MTKVGRARLFLAVSTCLLAIACTGAANADPPHATDKPEKATEAQPPVFPPAEPGVVWTREWYGWQTLTADAVSVPLIVAGLTMRGGTASSVLGGLGLAGWIAGAPVVHAFHRRFVAALGDAALRVALPFIGGLVGVVAIAPRCASQPWSLLGEALCTVPGDEAGTIWGASAASAIDAAFLAFQRRVVGREPAGRLGWTPTVVAVRGGLTVGVGGGF